mmetsp:Transcript_38133/g.81283  ORF Transcript_38133/g.81283 Transcript_38133/m.81283 type:complete len:98 (+) Transcript_38133:739-1032(+)
MTTPVLSAGNTKAVLDEEHEQGQVSGGEHRNEPETKTTPGPETYTYVSTFIVAVTLHGGPRGDQEETFVVEVPVEMISEGGGTPSGKYCDLRNGLPD